MDDPTLLRRFEAIETQLELLSRAAGVPYDPPGTLPVEVQTLVVAGKKTEAIALLRRLQGLSLLEAKNAVDSAG